MFWPSLVNLYILPLLIVVVITAGRRFPFVAGSLLAICWISIFHSILIDWNKDKNAKILKVEGEIISLVGSNSDWISVDIVLIDSILPRGMTGKLRLFWQNPPPISVGQRWQLTIKPKPITSILNQGGFNQQKHFVANHIIAKGKVISGKLVSKNSSYRTGLIEELTPVLRLHASGDLILALVSGDKSLIQNKRWQELRVSGAGHLFAISGLHLSVISMWILFFTRFCLYRFLPVNHRRNWLLSIGIAAAGAMFYGYLAGFSISTKRALVMILAYILFSALSRHSSSWERLLYALFVLLLLDPLSILSASFWLSFSALAIILWTITRYYDSKNTLRNARVEEKIEKCDTGYFERMQRKISPAVKTFWAVQWRLTIGLGVIQAIFFSGTSMVSLLVNIVLLPWFSFLLIPVSLLSLLMFILATRFGFDGRGMFDLSALLMEPVVWILDYANSLTYAWLPLSDELIAALALLCLGCYLACNITHSRWRWALSIMMLPIALQSLFLLFSLYDTARWQVHILDVGQGLSVIVEHNKRALIYDTGARYGDSFSYAERAIKPFLVSKGINDVDFIVVSHGDNDHAGGAGFMIDNYPAAEVISDINPLQNLSCRPQSIAWQQLNIEILAPSTSLPGNNGSCVLRVDDSNNSVLLTGDIEKQAELALITAVKLPHTLKSQLLIAPHHGSKTSSTEGFIDAVAPELVVFPAGFRNRYGFPKNEVVARYQKRRIPSLTVGNEGQVSVLFEQNTMKVRTYRTDLAPFWYNQVFRFGLVQNPE
ncbi:DNA internalization-related competence protein ComEC/Rec2 [Shewanella sairae]|nr:DNA internalization-related competence protein ComEC/Rec2 [Shewanella sairae]MCL1129457.1 DNA internalization-related competence protein ComEC/Rec2 [Shewanella sairae]